MFATAAGLYGLYYQTAGETTKRKYGYYTLPVLFGDRFVGRIEAVPDRKNSVLEVRGLWWEPVIRQTQKLNNALERKLVNFAKFNDCKSIRCQ